MQNVGLLWESIVNAIRLVFVAIPFDPGPDKKGVACGAHHVYGVDCPVGIDHNAGN